VFLRNQMRIVALLKCDQQIDFQSVANHRNSCWNSVAWSTERCLAKNCLWPPHKIVWFHISSWGS